MPSSYSTNLLLELMADGENEGLWGDITNENLEILGRAAGGVGNISLAETTHTLTVSQGQLSEGQYSTLVLGGSPTGTNTITIQPNTVTRTYLVQNNSGQDAVFTQGSGGNVTVPNGGTAIVFCSGAGASSSVTDITADFLRGVNNLSDLDDPDTALQNLGLTATAAEINKLDGATLDLAAVTATAAEVNVLDGSTATTADLNKLASVTATADEINTLDGFTGDTADLNYVEELRATGVTASEFDKLDGLTATTAELNHVDGVTSSIQTQLNAKYEAETQSEATWEAGTSTTESLVSPAKVKAAVEANAGGGLTFLGTLTTTSGTTQTLSGLDLTGYKFLRFMVDEVSHDTSGVGETELLLEGVNISAGFVSFRDVSGVCICDLSNGVSAVVLEADLGTPGNLGISTATTSLTFSWSNSASFDNGQILVYGEA